AIRPAPALSQFIQATGDRVRAIIVKPEPVDERVLPWKTKNARLGISRLRFCGHGSDLNETEAHRGPGRQRDAVFVEPCGKPDRISKGQTEKLFRGRRWVKNFKPARRNIEW